MCYFPHVSNLFFSFEPRRHMQDGIEASENQASRKVHALMPDFGEKTWSHLYVT